MKPQPSIVCVVGLSGVGKTTVLVALVREIKARGYRVGTVKHDAHDFEIDVPGKDSWRHGDAGSDCVLIASPHKVAMIRRLESELSLDEVAALAVDVDLIIVEGYKRSDKPKIEVSRREKGSHLLCDSGELLALATDQRYEVAVPQFALDDTAGLVSLLEEKFLKAPRRPKED